MRTTAQERKQQLLAELGAVRQNILALAGALTPEQGEVIFLGSWAVSDLIAHLIGWDFTNMQATQDILADQLPQFYAFHDRDWQRYNARLVAEYKKDQLSELIADANASHHQLLALLQTIPADEFERDRDLRFRGWKVTIARLLRAEAEDEQKHLTQLRGFASDTGQTDGDSDQVK
jgi:hypothetical protein